MVSLVADRSTPVIQADTIDQINFFAKVGFDTNRSTFVMNASTLELKWFTMQRSVFGQTAQFP